MNLSDIHAFIKAGESKTLEFKTSTAKLKSAFETLCAFLNTEGGSVLIGVKDHGEVVGQAVTDKTRLEIANMAAKFEPAIRIAEAYIAVGDQYVIQLTATPYPEMIPYVFDGKPFWRIGSSTRRMPQQAYQQMLMDRADALQFWNAETTTPLTIEDLDQSQILHALDESIKRGRTTAALATKDPKSALQTLGLLKNGLITHAGGMLFCRDAETHFPQSLLRLVLFKGLTKSDILDSRRIYDNAFALLAETEAFLMRHMSIASEFIPGKMARKDHPEYSLRALREAIVNAICHRDYRIQGGSISLMMYDNRLEITSHGTLPRGITVDDLKQVHESFPRNAKITHVMYKCGVIESVGSGTQEMIQECQAIGAPEPEYIEKGTTFMVRFYKNKQDQQPEVLTPRQKEILNIMASRTDCTTTQIRQTIKEPPTDRTLRSDLAQLEALGYVLRQGEGPATRWRVT